LGYGSGAFRHKPMLDWGNRKGGNSSKNSLKEKKPKKETMVLASCFGRPGNPKLDNVEGNSG